MPSVGPLYSQIPRTRPKKLSNFNDFSEPKKIKAKRRTFTKRGGFF